MWGPLLKFQEQQPASAGHSLQQELKALRDWLIGRQAKRQLLVVFIEVHSTEILLRLSNDRSCRPKIFFGSSWLRVNELITFSPYLWYLCLCLVSVLFLCCFVVLCFHFFFTFCFYFLCVQYFLSLSFYATFTLQFHLHKLVPVFDFCLLIPCCFVSFSLTFYFCTWLD